MNRSALKKYAPQARKDFIEAVTQRARRLGLDPDLAAKVEQTGEVLLINGQPFEAKIAKQRETLVQRIRQQGFDSVMEALAYTWFNRLVAIRYLELHEYLHHGYRVLSNRDGGLPEVLEQAQHLDLPGLDKELVLELKIAGNKDEELFREILLAQCHSLHRAMPFLFEDLDDATELLLPDNLLRTDSVVAKLVNDIDEGDWEQVEIIGWLYQFYISEKKDQVIGKVVKSEDIPAATQLFTPNWIVQYLVQNSLGRLWLMANPGSNLKEKMPYYIEPAEQTPEVQAQLDALIKVRMDEDGGTLNPESLTVLDPACGSGLILVEAYNLLRAIYEERGYRLRDIPRLILQKNLFGLDIDDRAAQLAGFALLMKAREDDRRLFEDPSNPPILNVVAIQDSNEVPEKDMAATIMQSAIEIEGGDAFQSGQLFGGGQLQTQHSSGLSKNDIREIIQLFQNGKTFGSLVTVPDSLKVKLGKIIEVLRTVAEQGDDLSRSYANEVLRKFAWPASLLAMKYDAVVANPPYMGASYHINLIKDFVRTNYSEAKADLYSVFMLRCMWFGAPHTIISLMTPFTWLSIRSFESIRRHVCLDREIICLVQPEYHAFFESAYVPICAFSIRNTNTNSIGVFADLSPYYGADVQAEKFLEVTLDPMHPQRYEKVSSSFVKLPGGAILFGLGNNASNILSVCERIGDIADVTEGVKTGNNSRFLRSWQEVSIGDSVISNGGEKKWVPYHKGGEYRRWYGNLDYVINWENDGAEIKAFPSSGLQGKSNYFSEGVTWSKLSSSYFGVRILPEGVLFDSGSPAVFPHDKSLLLPILGFLSSKVASFFIKKLNPTLNFQVGNVSSLPFPLEAIKENINEVNDHVSQCVRIAKELWDCYETSWGFQQPEILTVINSAELIAKCFEKLCQNENVIVSLMRGHEREINKIFIDALELQDELCPDVAADQLTITRTDRVRGMQRLVSYAFGCMMGRYSLDEPGLIYAHSGNIGFDPSRYTKFPADADGIIPVTDEPWFEDDAAERVREFVEVVWGKDTLVENMEWLADSLGRKAGETADDAIRRYLSASFFKDHLQTYKKRPIYWLFSSGKQKAFECLVYLHRYNEGTLSRMRMEYVVPLQSRMQGRIDQLAEDINSAGSSAQQKKLQKQQDKLIKQLEELRRFDEKLRHYADQRISLDLDDGVKVNYGKFGDLLAEVKAVTGGKEA